LIKRLKNVKFGRNTSGYILTSPEDKIFEIDDLTKFCNEQVELNRYGFIRILNGKRTSYKGWKIKRVGVLK
jgi:hypothetical protein